MATKKKRIDNLHLVSWDALNEHLMTCDEEQAKALLKEELDGRKRGAFVKRIHSRVNKLRADRERAELEAKL